MTKHVRSQEKKYSFIPRYMVYNYTIKPSTTVLNSTNFIALSYQKWCTIYASYTKCGEEGLHFILSTPLRPLAYPLHLYEIRGVAFCFLGPYLRHFALSMRHLCTIQGVIFGLPHTNFRLLALSMGHLCEIRESDFIFAHSIAVSLLQ